MLAELVGPKYRALATNTVWIGYAAAPCLVALHAYFIREWRLRLRVLTAPYILFLLFWR